MAADSDGNVVDNDTGDSITTIVTCEGDYFDPKFHEEFKVTLDRLECLLCDSEKLKTDERGKRNEDCNFDCVDDSSSDSEVPDKPSDDDGGDRKNKLKVAKLEPWNSVRVTLAIPREAAARLRQLAAEGSAQLRQLGILSVQIEGDQVISLRIASRFGNEDQTQEIVLNTTGSVQNGSDINATPGTSGLNAQAASGITRLLQSAASASTGAVCTDQIPPGPIPVTPGATSANGIDAGGVQESKVPFRSPNVICPTDTQVPRVAAGPSVSSGSGSASRSHYNGPFPFASMQQAAQAIQSRVASGLDPHHGSGPLNINAAPTTTNNRLVVGPSANNSASQQMVSGTSGSVSYAQPPPPYPSTVQTAVQKTSVQPNQPNIAITSPLLVNLLQTDGSPQGTCGAPVAPKPVPPNIGGPGARKGVVKQQPPLSRVGSELSECPGDNENAPGVNGSSNNLLSGPQSAFAVVSGAQTSGLKLQNQPTSTPHQLVPQLSSSVPSNIASTLPQQNVIRTAANNLNIANPRLIPNHYGVSQQRVLVAQRPNPQNMPAPSLVPQQVPHQAALVKQNVVPMLPSQKTPVNHKAVFMNRPEIGQLDQTGYRQGPQLPVGQSPFPVGQQPSNFSAVANSAATSAPGFPGAQAPPPYPASNRTTGFQQDFQQKLLQQQSQSRLWGGQYNPSNDNMMPIGQPMPSNVPQYTPTNQNMQPIAQPMPQIVPNNLNLDSGLSHITPSLTDLSKTDLDSLLPSLDMDEAVDLLNSDLGVPLPEPIVEPEPQLTSKGKRRLFLINPLSGVLEPMPSDSSDSESETDAKKDKEMDVFSELNDKSSLFSDDEDTSSTTNSRSKANHENDQSDSDAALKSAASDTGAKRSKNVKNRDRNRSPALVKAKFSSGDKNKTADVGKMKNLIDGKIKNIDKINKSLESYSKISKSAESTLKNKDSLKCKGVSCESPMSKVRNQALNKLGSGGLLMGKDTPTEKIKLRLKLEKSEPVNPAYKVDVSFVNLQEPKKAATNASAVSTKSNSDIGSSNLATHLPSAVPNSSPGEELRVPPLHISLRGRNSVVISNKSKKYKNSDDLTSISDSEKQLGTFKKSKIRNKDKDINLGSVSAGLKIKNKTVNKDAVKNSLVSTNSFKTDSLQKNVNNSSDSVSNSDDDSSSNDTLLNYKSAMSSTKPMIINKSPMLKSLTNKKVLDDDELPLGYKREPGEIVMPSLKSFGNDSNKKLSKKINKLSHSETYREQNLLSGGHTLYSATDKSHKKLKIDTDAFKTKSRHDQEIIKAGVKRQLSDSLVNGILRESPDTKKRRLSQPSLDGFPDSSVSSISPSLKSKPATIGSSNAPTMTTSSGSPIVKQNTNVLSGSIGSTNVGTVPPYKTISNKSVGLKSNSLTLKTKRDKERTAGSKSKDDRPSMSSPKSKDINRDKTYSKIVAEKRQQQNNEALKATTGLLSLPTAGELDMEAKFKQRLMENSDMSYNPKHHKPGDGSGGFSDTSTTKRFSGIIGGKTSHVVLNRITTELDHRYHSIRMDGKKAGGKLTNSSDNLKMTKNSLENKNSMKKINDSRQTDCLPGIQNNGKYGGKMSEKDSMNIQRKMSREENLSKTHEDSKSNEQKSNSNDKMESRLCFEENSEGIIKRSESEEHVLRIMGDRNSLLLKSSNAETGLKKERLDDANVILRDSDANTIAQILRSSTNPISKQCQDLQNLAASATDIDILKQAAGRSPPTSNTGQGEDSGIESMDASSEKSPLQSGQSPHCHTELAMNDPTVKSISDSLVVVADYNKRTDDAYRLTEQAKNCGVESNTNEKIISSLVKDLSSGECTSLENEIIKDNLLASNTKNSETRLPKAKSDYEIGDIEAELAKMEGLTGGNGDSDSYGQKSQVSLDSVYSFTESDCDIKESLRHNKNAKSDTKCKIEIKNEEENCIKNESNYYAGDEALTVFKKDKDVNENKRDKTITIIKEEIDRNDDFTEHKQKLKLNNHAVNPVAEKLCEAKIKSETEQNFLDKSNLEKSNSRQKQENQIKQDQKKLDNIVGIESNKDDTKNDLVSKNDASKCSENIDTSLENCVIDDFDPLPIRRTPPLYTYSNPEKQMRDNNDSPLLRGLSDLEDSDNSDNDHLDSEDESADMKMNSSLISEKSVTQTRSRKDRNILCSTDSTASDDNPAQNFFSGDLKIDKKMANIGQKSLLEQLLIEIPGDNSDKSMSSLSHSPAVSDKNFPKSNVRTRASSKLNSPDANPDPSRMNLRTPKHSPVILKGDSRANSPAQTGCKNSPKVVVTAGKVATVKRKRRESESSTQSTQSVEDAAAQTRNKKTRKCSENAVGLIKACMGVDGENSTNKSNPVVQSNAKTAAPTAVQKTPVTNASASKSVIKTTVAHVKNNVVVQRKQNPLDVESSDSDEPLIEIAGKQKVSVTKSIMATRNSKLNNSTVPGKGMNVAPAAVQNQASKSMVAGVKEEQKLIGTRRSIRSNAGININLGKLKTRNNKTGSAATPGPGNEKVVGSVGVQDGDGTANVRRKTRSAVSEASQQDNAASAINKRTRRNSKDGK